MQTTKTISYDTRVQTFWVLVTLLILAAALYIYSINAAVRNTAVRERLEEKLANITLRETQLEFAYIEQKNAINLDIAYARGFKEVKSPLYVSSSRANSLSINTAAR